MTRLVILDRDGVINHDSHAFIKSPAEWRPIDGSLGAIAALTDAGFTVAVASNQSGIGRGMFSAQELDAIHAKMHTLVLDAGGRIDRIVYCPHLPDAGCDCRKPGPGLLHQLADYYDVALTGVPVIGDSERDLQAATAAGARPVLVLTGNGQRTRQALDEADRQIDTFDDLAAATDALIADSREDSD